VKLSYLPAFGALALASVIGTAAADAQPPSQWRTLASRSIRMGSTRDTVPVNSRNRYRQVQVCVLNAPLRLNSYTVRFDNNRVQTVRVNSRVNTGACTRATSLTSAPRRITRIDLAYQQVPRGSRAPQVRVVGR